MQVILLSYPGISGEAMIQGYQGLAACKSLTVNNAKSEESGDLAPAKMGDALKAKKDGETERAGIDSVTVTRQVDKASPKFMAEVYTKKQSDESATIYVFRAFERQDLLGLGSVKVSLSLDSGASISDGGTAWHEPFIKFTLTDVHIKAHEMSVDEGDLSETLTISCRELTMEYYVFQNGKRLGSVLGHVDFADKSS